ncbi:peptidoglycan-binding protein [Streptomyces sp. NBC_01500]|uniref:peptidoglycan-binding domain-containing protein n=1 Tax=Streptomyces sp. NBC_01500 TaxID=2903886 RepID=UPI00224C9715|nr:peptidoglycan-binding domain-containing protein [Streptomyces sp. NBC_01500]MCX4551377.1 peptidoglycan-binding protein [Streptomyces sp. NBC_01500]
MPSILVLRHNRREFKGVAELSHEDFDPLRIRPYVQLPDPEPDPADDVVGAAYPTEPVKPAEPPVMPMPTVPTVPLQVVRLPVGGPGPEPSPRRKPFAVLAGGVAALAVLGGAAFAAGLFQGGGSVQDHALPDTVTSAPDLPARPSAVPSPSAPSAPPSGPRATAAVRPSPTAARSGPPPSATPAGSAPAVAPSAPAQPPSPVRATTPAPHPESAPPDAPVLRAGDSGPEVVELQQRLTQLYVYRDTADGRFDQQVTDAVREYQSWMSIHSDPPGVYGPATRRALEAMTRQP